MSPKLETVESKDVMLLEDVLTLFRYANDMQKILKKKPKKPMINAKEVPVSFRGVTDIYLSF